MGQAASRQEAFWEACGFGHEDRVKKFLEDGDIDVNWVSYTHDCCPIHVASQGKPNIVRMLLEKGAKVNVKDVRGSLPIHHAAMKGHNEVVKILIDAGSEIDTQDKNGWTALHCAAYWSKPDVVKCLLKYGADVHIQNKDQRTALHETARSQQMGDFDLGEIAHGLIEAGSDVNAKSSDLGEADFTGLMFASYHNHPEVASALINAGCEINAFGTNRWTALHWACDRGNEEIVFLLLEAGIDPTIRGWRNELASDRCQSDEVKEMVMNAVNMFEEMSLLDHKVSGDNIQKGSSKSPVTIQQLTNNLTTSKGKTTVNTESGTKDTTTKSDKSESQPKKETKKSEKQRNLEGTHKSESQPNLEEIDESEKQPNSDETDKSEKQDNIEETNKGIVKVDSITRTEQLEKVSSPSKDETRMANDRETSECEQTDRQSASSGNPEHSS
ncbi:ankyrin repeat and sterile alpha motif domain-containing protein 1B-like [Ostrea edulis]|uniref:ankyrin repeat and sterile alpha motif domain-containing protein 1B-like n=1 Tax=Ostrea edulis TaxID=37623 RepID=UPI0024AEB946|nr:ankyrin repeat and sterile alpha motif domain-containing protein 1B-like [Ostrea edulis]XP_055995317.1 ankyrin repeat and sterile alpha motif domain-containing protein 1B-like [Ostrea edulis]